MFRGNNSNTAAPSFHLQYPAADILNQLQLCGNLPVEYSSDPVNYLGSNNGTPFLLPNKCVRDAEAIPSQQKLMFSLYNKTLNDESDRKGNMLNLNPVSTGLRLSYDDEERNSSITSASVLTDSCTLITINTSKPLVAQGCNASHASLCMLDMENKCHAMHCYQEYLIVLAVVSGLIFCTALAVVFWLLIYKRNKRRKRSRKPPNPAELALVPPSWKVFTREELMSITKSFSEGNRLLGDAKTGGTYSGLLPDGSRVAVKRLKRSSFQRKKEFYSEIGRVARLHHPNLVAIKGCCYDHGDRYIMYEFIASGPLDRWLHHVPRGGRTLDWATRMKVAMGLAQGIAEDEEHPNSKKR